MQLFQWSFIEKYKLFQTTFFGKMTFFQTIFTYKRIFCMKAGHAVQRLAMKVKFLYTDSTFFLIFKSGKECDGSVRKNREAARVKYGYG